MVSASLILSRHVLSPVFTRRVVSRLRSALAPLLGNRRRACRYTHTHTRTRTYARKDIRTIPHTNDPTHAHARTHAHTHARTTTHTNDPTHAHTHMHVRTSARTNTHTNDPTCTPMRACTHRAYAYLRDIYLLQLYK